PINCPLVSPRIEGTIDRDIDKRRLKDGTVCTIPSAGVVSSFSYISEISFRKTAGFSARGTGYSLSGLSRRRRTILDLVTTPFCRINPLDFTVGRLLYIRIFLTVRFYESCVVVGFECPETFTSRRVTPLPRY
ncbi:unnamed protein product, partial [Ectocarpus sp. 6 AP-2014]